MSNGSVEIIDAEDNRSLANPRLLNPADTPENLKTFAFGVGCPMPTRVMGRESAIALRSLAYPMFGNPIHYSPDSMEVGEARNEIVRMALQDGVKWLFFMDYDVAPPPNALVKLLSLNKKITAGVYHSKSVPSYPLIFVKGWKYAFEDYEIGDLISVDGIGMGCTLISMDVFGKIDPPWFKTVPGYSRNSSAILPHMTEDIYACEKFKKAGFEIIVDTSVQAQHVDWNTGMIYQGVTDVNGKSKRVTPSWIYRRNGSYIVEHVAAADHPGAKWSYVKPPKKIGMKIDLGSGDVPAAGYTGVDLYASNPGVLKGDISDLGWFRKEHGLVDAIRSSHSLEHLSHRDTARILRDWVSTLKPGGKIEVRVPDLEYHARRFIAAVDSGDDRSPEADYWLATIYGWQIGEGQEHKNGFTENRLRQLARSCGLNKIKIDKQINKGSPTGEIAENGELVLTAERAK